MQYTAISTAVKNDIFPTICDIICSKHMHMYLLEPHQLGGSNNSICLGTLWSTLNEVFLSKIFLRLTADAVHKRRLSLSPKLS